jgi:hypothetical protein
MAIARCRTSDVGRVVDEHEGAGRLRGRAPGVDEQAAEDAAARLLKLGGAANQAGDGLVHVSSKDIH